MTRRERSPWTGRNRSEHVELLQLSESRTHRTRLIWDSCILVLSDSGDFSPIFFILLWSLHLFVYLAPLDQSPRGKSPLCPDKSPTSGHVWLLSIAPLSSFFLFYPNFRRCRTALFPSAVTRSTGRSLRTWVCLVSARRNAAPT